MADTVRNVTLRVNVEMGEMRLGSADMSAARRAMDEMRKELQGQSASVSNVDQRSQDRDLEKVNEELKQLVSNLNRVNSSWQSTVTRSTPSISGIGGSFPTVGGQQQRPNNGLGQNWWRTSTPLPKGPPPLPKPQNGGSGVNEMLAALTALGSRFATVAVALKAAHFGISMVIEQLKLFNARNMLQLGRTQTHNQKMINTQMFEADLYGGFNPIDVFSGRAHSQNMNTARRAEADVRAYEADKYSHTESQQQFYRDRSERDVQYKSAVNMEEAAVAHSQKKVSTINRGLEAAEFARQQSKLNAGAAERDREEALKNLREAGNPGGAHREQGRADINAKADELVAEAKRQELEAEEKLNELNKQKTAELGKQLQSQQKIHELAVNQANAANQDVNREKQALRNSNIYFGGLDYGTQARLKNLQAKHERIERQRAANKAAGRAEMEGVERYTQEEGNFVIQHGNIAARTAKAQFEHDNKKSGLKGEEVNEDTLREKEERAKAAQELADETAKAAEDKAEQAQADVEENAKTIVAAMEDIFAKKREYEELLKALADLKAKQAVDTLERWGPSNWNGTAGGIGQ